MTYYEVCNKYNLEKAARGNSVLITKVSTKKLSNIAVEIKARIRELGYLIDKLLKKTFTGSETYIKARELIRKRELTKLSDEEYYSKLILTKVEDELIRRKRNFNSMPQKALNNGGVYTTGIMSAPRVGMGFRGYSGICL